MKFILNQIFKKSKDGGTYYCTIHEIYCNPNRRYELSSVDSTERRAEQLGLKYNKGMIEVLHGSGTGIMIIRDGLMKYAGAKPENIIDVSI